MRIMEKKQLKRTPVKSFIYYSHSFHFYNSEIERADIEFLQSQGEAYNPNGRGRTRAISEYLLAVSESDVVWYRGNTIGVAFEVLTALALQIPVFSLETKQRINKAEITILIDTLRNSPSFSDDLVLFEAMFPHAYPNFLRVLRGDIH